MRAVPIRRRPGIRSRTLLLLLLAVLAAGCSGSVQPSVGAADKPGSGAEGMPEVTVGRASTGEEISEETAGSRDVPFVVGREARGGSSYEADTVLAIRHGLHENYERVVVDLGTGQEAAETMPEWNLTSMTDGGLLCALLSPRRAPPTSRTAPSATPCSRAST